MLRRKVLHHSFSIKRSLTLLSFVRFQVYQRETVIDRIQHIISSYLQITHSLERKIYLSMIDVCPVLLLLIIRSNIHHRGHVE